MQNIQHIGNDLIYVGASDRRLALFENVYPIPRGVSYNSYVMLDDKNVLFDTCDSSVSGQFFENVKEALEGRMLDYVVVHHMEPDHAATLMDILIPFPEATVVCTAKAAQMIEQFFAYKPEKMQVVKEGDEIVTGRHRLQFIMAPMVHWPEVMMTYDATDKVLFSADAFGTFGALSGNIFADEVDFEREWIDDARRYYTNIVGKYGVQVQNVLKKAAALDIKMICPLHGPVWRSNLEWFIGKHDLWSRYEPEDRGVVIIYGSIYGHTEAAAMRLGTLLAQRGVNSTYNNGIFTPMENLLLDLKAHAWQRRTVALIENGSWAPQSGKLMRAELEQMKDITIVGDTVSLKSAATAAQEERLAKLADAIAATL